MQVGSVRKGFDKGVANLTRQLHSLAPAPLQATINNDEAQMVSWGVPQALASQIAQLPFLASACDIVEAAELTGRSIREIAELYFDLGEHFHLRWLRHQARAVEADTSWQRLANQSVVTELYQAQQRLVLHVTMGKKQKTQKARTLFNEWAGKHQDALTRYRQQMDPLIEHDSQLDYAMLLVALRHVGWLVSQ